MSFEVGSQDLLRIGFICFTILLLLLVKEPKRGASDGLQESKDNAPPLSETFAFMRSQKSLVYLMAASVLGFQILALPALADTRKPAAAKASATRPGVMPPSPSMM